MSFSWLLSSLSEFLSQQLRNKESSCFLHFWTVPFLLPTMMLGRLISASILFRCERLIHTLSASSSRDIPRSVRNILIVSPISRSPMYISLPPGVLYYIDQKYICIVTTGDIFFIYFPFRFYTIF